MATLAIQQTGLDDAAYSKAYGDYQEYVKKVLTCNRCPIEMLDDLAADTWTRVYEKRALFDPERGTLATWLSAVARNVLREYWRKQGREVETIPLSDIGEADNQAAPGPAGQIALCHDLETVMSPGDREILPLLLEGCSVPEIAHRLGIKEKTAENKVARLRQRVQKYLRPTQE